MSSQAGNPASAGNGQRTFLGHPVGLYVLFFTEMWERFSYYGMRGLLALYMINYFKWASKDASMTYKWYTSLVYITPLLGGYLADRYLGNRRAVIIGAILMAIGHFLMAFEEINVFFMALGFLIIGNGFFKPNMSTQVGRLYPQNDPRRDGAYTIFYMGINLGAFLSPLLCGWLQENTVGGYHTGFTLAGIGMVVGLFTYLFGMRWVIELPPDGKESKPGDMPAVAPETEPAAAAAKTGEPLSEKEAEKAPAAAPLLNKYSPQLFLLGSAIAWLCAALYVGRGLYQGSSIFELLTANTIFNLASLGILAAIGAWVLTKVHNALRDRVLTIFALGLFVVFFWAGFEQSGSTMNAWADKSTERYLTKAPPPLSKYPDITKPSEEEGQASLGFLNRWVVMWQLKPSKEAAQGWGDWLTSSLYPVPTAWFQSINALAIFVLAPLFAFLWVALARRGINLSIPTKMALGVLFMSLAYIFMMAAAQFENQPTSVAYNQPLPTGIEERENHRLFVLADGKKWEPCQAGRLYHDAASHQLHMTGVLSDNERDRIVRATVSSGYKEAVEDLGKQTETTKKGEVKLAEVPPGFDLRYAGFPQSLVSFDAKERLLAVNNLTVGDKEAKALLVAGGDKDFRDALDQLYVQSNKYRVSPWWLFWFFVLSTFGELCVSPVGLSMVSKLAPARFATMLMGLWFFTNVFGNYAAGALAEIWGYQEFGVIWAPEPFFLLLLVSLAVVALVLFVLVRKIFSMMHGVN